MVLLSNDLNTDMGKKNRFVPNLQEFMKNYLVFTFLICCVCINCKNKATTIPGGGDILFDHLDTTIAPGEDFFMYANGSWLKNNPIPKEETNWGIGNLVVNENYTKLRDICDKASKIQATKGSNDQRIGDFWKIAMDSALCDQLGISPIQKDLQLIDNIKDINSLLEVIALHKSYGIGSGFELYVGQDMKQSDKMTLYLNQGGLGLPNRDYYINQDERTLKIRNEYPNHISKMFQLIGMDSLTSKDEAKKILTFETQLAQSSKKLEDLRDPYANYNAYSIAQIKSLTPSIDWIDWCKKANINFDSAVIGQPDFFKTFEMVLQKSDLNSWKAYIKWHFIHHFAATLNKDINDEHFRFYSALLHGAEAQRPRWKRSLSAIENAMGDLLGQEFVKAYFSPKSKQRYSDMVEDIRTAFADHIRDLDWMSSTTKEKALLKLKLMTKKVGYPDHWKDFSSMEINRNSYFENVKNAQIWWYNDQISKLGKPVDRSIWDMTPQTYNAYYNPSNNEIVLPAAIFTVPGFRDEDLDDALVYGYAAASTIGHEITHGFDDEGKKFDEKGNLNNWWTKEDEDQFNKKAQLVVDQFNQFIVLDSLHVNGKATLGENIADLGGVVLGLEAFKKKEQYKMGKPINGLTPTQRYFLGYALGWLGHIRDERLASQILTDVHAPAKLRVNGPFVHISEFKEAFHIKEGMKMHRADSLQVKIW